MTEITLNNDEHIEYLSRDLGLIVSKEHTFGTDALLLADFASPKRYDICCDFGTGCGIIPMLWCRDGCGKEISAVEIQEKAAINFYAPSRQTICRTSSLCTMLI